MSSINVFAVLMMVTIIFCDGSFDNLNDVAKHKCTSDSSLEQAEDLYFVKFMSKAKENHCYSIHIISRDTFIGVLLVESRNGKFLNENLLDLVSISTNKDGLLLVNCSEHPVNLEIDNSSPFVIVATSSRHPLASSIKSVAALGGVDLTKLTKITAKHCPVPKDLKDE